jgi:UDP-N-acetyl-D-galactosamine dehydrogenase
MTETRRISIVGLGYVGLPLAVALAKHYEVSGFDVDAARIKELQGGHDRTGEIDASDLTASSLSVTDDPAVLAEAEIAIVTVPTPVTEALTPDLGAVRAASRTLGENIAKGTIVVFESTVYPGVTEDVCGPDIEAASGLVCGKEFFLGYSPERINPGDREHSVERITKVVAGQTDDVVEVLQEIYGKVTTGGVFVAKDIRTAEAAKVIENAQRDINIAFINEITMIFQKLGISTQDVLAAASTKWNFLNFGPGLVGGHCIGVDPYYLAHCAQTLGHNPEIVLAGRRINDGMGVFIADQLHQRLSPASRILILGLTFKENIPDLRNTRVVDLVRVLRQHGHLVEVHDALADPAEAFKLCGIELSDSYASGTKYDCILGAVAHDEYRQLSVSQLDAMLKNNGLLADVKGMWNALSFSQSTRRWQL